MELAAERDAVNDRLVRMQLADRPDKLAAGFRKSLAAWSSKRIGYSEAPEFAWSLEKWLEQVERELLHLILVNSARASYLASHAMRRSICQGF